MTGYCGRCRVHFTTLDEWAEHQHRPTVGAFERITDSAIDMAKDGIYSHSWLRPEDAA